MDTKFKLLGVAVNTQARRRWLVAVMYLSCLGLEVVFWAAHTQARLLLALALPLFLLLGATFWGLSQIVRAYAIPSSSKSRLPMPRSDERQAQVRDRSFVIAYQILSGVACLGMIYFMLASDFGWPLPSQIGIQGPLFGFILLSATLPSAVIAWIEPDPRDEVEDEVVASSQV